MGDDEQTLVRADALQPHRTQTTHKARRHTLALSATFVVLAFSTALPLSLFSATLVVLVLSTLACE
eukprot:4411956-Amphidinium_carterae.2